MSRLLRALLVGIVVGVAARVLMRLASLITGSDTEFDPAASTMIVAVFALAGIGACSGAMLFARSRLAGGALLTLTLVPLWLPGSSIAIVEVSEHATGPLIQAAGVVAIALLIVGGMVAAPLCGWRIGRSTGS
ncbi:MAG TPA: hypothetical protein VK948_00655 [Aeromicrobium sp.]|nr:hypothetical protein [Aeromicrobium sp.]